MCCAHPLPTVVSVGVRSISGESHQQPSYSLDFSVHSPRLRTWVHNPESPLYVHHNSLGALPQLGLEPIFTQSGQKLTCIFPVLFFSSEHLLFQNRVTRKSTRGVNPVEAWCHRTR